MNTAFRRKKNFENPSTIIGVIIVGITFCNNLCQQWLTFSLPYPRSHKKLSLLRSGTNQPSRDSFQPKKFAVSILCYNFSTFCISQKNINFNFPNFHVLITKLVCGLSYILKKISYLHVEA